jgi:DNA-binding transcriptional regulator YiaG
MFLSSLSLIAVLGVGAALVNAWESGISKPDEQKMKDLTRIFGCKFSCNQ